jgi:hypothetical protein
MPDRDQDSRRMRVMALVRRALLLGGVALSTAPLSIAPLCPAARAASLPPASSSSARFT